MNDRKLPRPLRGFLIACGIEPSQSWGRFLLSCIFVRIPSWSCNDAAALFPHVEFFRLRWSDAIRIPLQLLWLALVLPDTEGRRDRRRRLVKRIWRRLHVATALRLERCVVGLRHRLSRRDADRFGTLIESCARHSSWHARPWRYFADVVAVLLAVFAVVTPLTPAQQAVFAVLLWIFGLLAWRASGGSASVLSVALSAVVSARYFWWRMSFTLNWSEPAALLWGELLIAAELYAWLLVLSDITRHGKHGLHPLHGDLALFLKAGSRLVFLCAPLAGLLFDLRIIDASSPVLLFYVLPHVGHARLANRRGELSVRQTFLARVGNAARAWHAAIPVATWLERVSLTLFSLFLLGLAIGLRRLYLADDDPAWLVLNLLWAVYNLVFLLSMGLPYPIRRSFVRARRFVAWCASLLPRTPVALRGKSMR